jgi:predicted RNA-binding protein
MIDSFQTKVITFKEQVKKSLVDKENDYRKKIQHIENEYISQYEQVLEKNKQVVRALIASKQEEFDSEKVKFKTN